jgi:alcohol dehydrogenase
MVSIITTGETTKAGVVSRTLLADKIILDAALTTGLPPAVTAATGIDAMVHAIEAFTSKRLKNPLSDMLAREALRLMAGNIETAVKQGHNLEARSAMLMGAMLAGQAFANAPVAAVHGLAYPLGGNYHIPHGLSNSLVLPHVLRFNAPAAADLYAQLAPIILPGQQLPEDPIAVTRGVGRLLFGLGCRSWFADDFTADEYPGSGFINACPRGNVAAEAADQ